MKKVVTNLNICWDYNHIWIKISEIAKINLNTFQFNFHFYISSYLNRKSNVTITHVTITCYMVKSREKYIIAEII